MLFLVLLLGGWVVGIYLDRKHRLTDTLLDVVSRDTDTAQRVRILEGVIDETLVRPPRQSVFSLDEQRMINAAVQQPPQKIIEHFSGADWLYVRCGNAVGTFVTVYVFDIAEYSPHIVVRPVHFKGTLARLFVQLVEQQSVVLCEGIVDKDVDIFTRKGDGKQMIKKLHGLVQQHAAVLKPALEDNLRRWARGGTGRTKRDQLERQPIGPTDREYYEQSHGKLFTEF